MPNKSTKVPGVYMIRILPTEKVYIGESRDIMKRIRQHIWIATSDSTYSKQRNPIQRAIAKHGTKNMQITILHAGPKYADDTYRLRKEIAEIAEHKSSDPRYGYNTSPGGDCGNLHARDQSIIEKTKRAKALFLYDKSDDSCWLFFGGAKAIGKYLGYPKEKQYGKDIISHARIRGSVINSSMFVVFADRKLRNEQLDKLRVSKHSHTRGCAKYNAEASFAQYSAAVERINAIAKKYFGL